MPLEFLRGCGLSEALIKYIPSLIGKAFEFYSCFISYSTKDKLYADRLYADLQNIDDYLHKEWQHKRKADVLTKVVGDFRGWETPNVYRAALERLLAGLKSE